MLARIGVRLHDGGVRAVTRFVRRYPVVVATLVVLAIVLVLEVVGQSAAGRWTATIYVAGFIVWTAAGMLRAIRRGEFGLDILAVVAMTATLAVGEYIASLIVVLMLSGGEALEEYAAHRARRELTALLENSPRTARVLVDPEGVDTSRVREVAADEVKVGDVLLVRPAEIVPVDALLVTGEAEFDESSLTGESLPVTKSAGDEVLSGSINGSGAVRIRAIRESGDSQYQQIVALVAEAQASKAPVVRLADRFAIPFTLVSLAIAGIAWAVSGDPVRFAEVLVLATPCPLLIAAPVAFLAGMSVSSKNGVIVKGGGVLEQLSRVRAAAFDKTGTLTRGRPRLVAVRPAAGFAADEVLRYAASAEQYSTHALADGVRAAAEAAELVLWPAEAASEAATNGVTAVIRGRTVVVGKPAYVDSLADGWSMTSLEPGEGAAYVAIDGVYAGALVLADELRTESADVVSWLRAHGVDRIAMLTGDAAPTAQAIADLAGIDDVRAELLPKDKVRIAAELTPRPVMVVGDGVNDAPVLAAADVGVAMGARGATAAGEAADAVVLSDSLARIVDAVRIGRHTLRVALTAIWIGIALSIGLMLIATTGAIPAVAGALIQEFVDLATILYALRALRLPKTGGITAQPSAGIPQGDRRPTLPTA